MIDRMFLLSALVLAASGLTTRPLLAQSTPAPASTIQTWDLPHGTAVKDAGPRTYRFTVDYDSANVTGEVVHRQRVTGDYTRGLANGDVEWRNVGVAEVDGATAPFPAPQKQDFIEGFHYPAGSPDTLKPDFFKSFPPSAVLERNLIWDTSMFESFGQNFFDRLKLNVPLHISTDQDVNMPGVGTFHGRDMVLEWVGRSQRNGQDCAVIGYRAFFNPLEISNGGVTIHGRSDFWGEIWVSLATKQIEYATIYEEVSGQLKLPGQDTPQPLSVFRIGTLEPLNPKN
ncbi:MAG: hypothetical protein ABSF23_08880 [Terracidiphilus sp.]|jgi:hypothetical protein